MDESSHDLFPREYLSTELEELRKTMKNLNEDNSSPCQESYTGPSNYKAGMLTTQP
jgi:hypothetical protein